MSKWQPIKDAPRLRSVVVYAEYDDGAPFVGEAYFDRQWYWANGNAIKPDRMPVMFQPLPSPPRKVP